MTRLYCLLLHLYPTGFRREYGAGMAALFAERLAGMSALGRVTLFGGAVVDTVANAVPLHVELLWQDLRYTARALRRTPGFALTAILVTALAVGATTAALSVADLVLLRPLAFPAPEELVRLCAGPRDGPAGWGCNNQLSPADYRDMRQQTRAFEALGAYTRGAVNLTGVGEPQRVAAAGVTAEVLRLLGVEPVVGALPLGYDGTATVVLGHDLWRTRFGGDAGVAGRVVHLDGRAHVVAAVMPPGFHFPTRDAQLWASLDLVEEDYVDRTNNYLEAVGRLASGVMFEEARAELVVIADRLAAAYPDTNAETGVSFFRMRDEIAPHYRLMVQALCGAGVCILLLAAANLAGLMLARSGARRRELAVRTALGAGRERLVRQLLTETVALAALGGAAGVLVALLILPLLSLLVPATLPLPSAPGLDLRMLAAAALCTGLVVLGVGVLPALRAGGRSGLEALRGGRAGPAQGVRSRSVLVAVEVAACVVLLISAGLLLRAVLRVQAVDPGFEPDGVLAAQTVLPKPEYTSTARREAFYARVLEEVRRLPGVEAAAYTSGLPMVMTGGIARVTLPGQEVQPGGAYTVSRRYVTPQYFRTLRIPLLEGRDLEEADGTRGRVAVVSASFAERYWPGESPVGRAFLFQDSARTVVGVVGDVRVRGLERASEPQLYLPSAHIGDTPLSFHDPKALVIRTGGPETELVPAVRAIVAAVDPTQPLSDVTTLTDLLAAQTAPRRAQVRVLAALAVLAVLLAGLGIHGLLAYTVAQQRHDIAVRMALGAEPAAIARAVVRQGLGITLLGIVPGMLLALAAAGSLRALLFGVPSVDPLTIFLTLGLCLAMALTGAWLPAQRAVRVHPISVMRSD